MLSSRPLTVVYIATSIDQFIARANGDVDWLGIPDEDAQGEWAEFLSSIDRIVMGRKTWDSIGRPLPGRENIVVTRSPDFNAEGIHVTRALDEALTLAQTLTSGNAIDQIMVIGGAQIFDAVRAQAHRIYLTQIHKPFPGDVFFAPPNPQNWQESSRSERHQDPKSGLEYTYLIYDRPSR